MTSLLRLDSVGHDAERPAVEGGPIYWVNQAVLGVSTNECLPALILHSPWHRARGDFVS